jgi:hypothetical protein
MNTYISIYTYVYIYVHEHILCIHIGGIHKTHALEYPAVNAFTVEDKYQGIETYSYIHTYDRLLRHMCILICMYIHTYVHMYIYAFEYPPVNALNVEDEYQGIDQFDYY